MGGHPYWHGKSSAEPGRGGRGSAQLAEPGRAAARSRRGFVLFALALSLALGTVLMLIAASSVQAMSYSDALYAKTDGWVGLAAMGSVLVCALLGMIIVHRYTSTRHR